MHGHGHDWRRRETTLKESLIAFFTFEKNSDRKRSFKVLKILARPFCGHHVFN